MKLALIVSCSCTSICLAKNIPVAKLHPNIVTTMNQLRFKTRSNNFSSVRCNTINIAQTKQFQCRKTYQKEWGSTALSNVCTIERMLIFVLAMYTGQNQHWTWPLDPVESYWKSFFNKPLKAFTPRPSSKTTSVTEAISSRRDWFQGDTRFVLLPQRYQKFKG